MTRTRLLALIALLALATPAGAGGRSKRGKKPDEAAARKADVLEIPAEDGPAKDADDGDDKFWEKPPPGAVAPPKAPLSAPAGKPSKAMSPVRISGVLFDGRAKGIPEPDEAIRLSNLDPDRPADVGGFQLSDRFGPPRNSVAPAHSEANAPHDVVLPAGTRIPAGGEIWVALDGKVFRDTFGHAPDFQGRETLEKVPSVQLRPTWPTWNAAHGVVSLHDDSGEVVDLVPYERSPDGDALEKRDIPKGAWSGPSVMLYHASPYGWTGQVLARDRDAKGRVVPDTDSAEDWDSSFSRNRLGKDEIHRVELPGQSRLVFPRVEDPEAEITAASAPENGFAALKAAIEGAKSEVLVHIYQFENDHIADLLVEARKRGLVVVVACEGSPVGGLPDQERYIAEKLHAAGIPVWFIVSDPARGIRNRYFFDHSKYLLIDGELAVIGTENFGYSGHSLDPSYGNRGLMIHIRSKPFYRQLKRIWDLDVSPRTSRDIVGVADDPSDNWGFPYKHPPFNLRRAVITGRYPLRRPPLRTKGKATFELVACPDNCLSEKGAVIGLIHSAQKSLLVLQNSIPLWWGKKNKGSPDETPNLPLAAVVEAARRGVRVRVLLDGTWYNAEPYDPRDNDDTVRWLNDLATREKLDLEAKVVNLASTSLEKIHAKGLIADGRRTFVGSINWTENSYKANREIGVVVDHPDVASYYGTLFQRDWDMTRLYRARIGPAGARVQSAAKGARQVVAEVKAGELMDVVAEQPGFLEVRLTEKTTGYLPEDAVDERVAVPDETPALLGRLALVRGRVKGTHVSKAGVYLNFGLNWRGDFSVLIPSSALPAFRAAGLAQPEALEGREVEVEGLLYEKDGPQMRVETPRALREVR
jgi:phosphatidylserine/phosphatidylglycerophosphate/cardiolipin synthase-like enzyme